MSALAAGPVPLYGPRRPRAAAPAGFGDSILLAHCQPLRGLLEGTDLITREWEPVCRSGWLVCQGFGGRPSQLRGWLGFGPDWDGKPVFLGLVEHRPDDETPTSIRAFHSDRSLDALIDRLNLVMVREVKGKFHWQGDPAGLNRQQFERAIDSARARGQSRSADL